MNRFSQGVVNKRILILVIGVLLLIPSFFGYVNTRVNYDILSYLPEDIETMKGEEILEKEFGCGAFSFCVVEGMENKDVASLKAQMEQVPHVKQIIWYDSVADLSIPVDILPDKIENAFINEENNSTLMVIMYDTTMSADETMDAVKQMRSIASKNCYIAGMSAVVADTKDLCMKETPIYVLIAVALSCIVLALTMDSFLIPIFFLLSIGFAIVYNLGSNIFMGEISYITKALSAVLQLGVTMDYSIFLWHSYEEQQALHPKDKNKAMAEAITATFNAVVSSSVTTVAGFIALCFMSFTLGLDLGIVMAKGVVLGVISCVTILPSMILVFDRVLEKTKHKPILPDIRRLPAFVLKHYKVLVIAAVILLVPVIYGYTHTSVYYNLDSTLPKSLPSVQANEKLDENFDINSMHIVMTDSQMSEGQTARMVEEMADTEGIQAALNVDSMLGGTVPHELLPSSVKDMVMNEDYQLSLLISEYATASAEVNEQVDTLNQIVKSYDEGGMVVGEAPCTKDLIEITDTDFKVVSMISIGIIFLIIALTFRSISLPVILVAVIEFAIFINMGIPYYTHTKLPFIASVVIGTIQLGSTVDYAILMTTRYRTERREGKDKKEAVNIALSTSMRSVMVSALSFFAATFGVGMYSNIDMISSLCTLMSRGALVSMLVVIFILPAMYMIFDKVIVKTSVGFLAVKQEKKNQNKKIREIRRLEAK